MWWCNPLIQNPWLQKRRRGSDGILENVESENEGSERRKRPTEVLWVARGGKVNRFWFGLGSLTWWLLSIFIFSIFLEPLSPELFRALIKGDQSRAWLPWKKKQPPAWTLGRGLLFMTSNKISMNLVLKLKAELIDVRTSWDWPLTQTEISKYYLELKKTPNIYK